MYKRGRDDRSDEGWSEGNEEKGVNTDNQEDEEVAESDDDTEDTPKSPVVREIQSEREDTTVEQRGVAPRQHEPDTRGGGSEETEEEKIVTSVGR